MFQKYTLALESKSLGVSINVLLIHFFETVKMDTGQEPKHVSCFRLTAYKVAVDPKDREEE